jgi:hypothetical protein
MLKVQSFNASPIKTKFEAPDKLRDIGGSRASCVTIHTIKKELQTNETYIDLLPNELKEIETERKGGGGSASSNDYRNSNKEVKVKNKAGIRRITTVSKFIKGSQ